MNQNKTNVGSLFAQRAKEQTVGGDRLIPLIPQGMSSLEESIREMKFMNDYASKGATMMTLREVLHLAEERAAVLRALDMDKDRDDSEYSDLKNESEIMCSKLIFAVKRLPVEQRQQLMALYDALEEII